MLLKKCLAMGVCFLTSIIAFSQEKAEQYNHEKTIEFFHQQTNYRQQFKSYGPSSRDKPVRAFYTAMGKHATKSQIMALLQDEHAITRAYALNVLHDYYPKAFLNKAIPLLKDHARLSESKKMGGYVQTISSIIFLWIHQSHKASGRCFGIERPLKVSQKQEEKITQILLKEALIKAENGKHHEIQPYAFRIFMKHWGISEAYAEEIRSLAKLGFDEALIPLSQWKQTSDMPLILERLEYGDDSVSLRAIAHWPHPRFAAYVDRIFAGEALTWDQSDKLFALYNAAFAYPPAKTRMWVESVLDRTDMMPEVIKRHLSSMESAFRVKYGEEKQELEVLMREISRFQKGILVGAKKPRIPF